MSAVNTDLGGGRGFSHTTDPRWYPLTAALAAEARSIDPRLRSWGVRVVEKCPAPAACRPDQREIYLAIQWWAAVDPDGVGTPEWYLRHRDIAGAASHEWAHALWSPKDFNSFIKSVPTEGQRVLILLEESRVEHRWINETLRGARSLSIDRRELLAAVMRASMFNIVLRDIKSASDAARGSWQRVAELYLLVEGRIIGGSARRFANPQVERVSEELRRLFDKTQWDELDHLTRRYHDIMDVGHEQVQPTVAKIVATMVEIFKAVAEGDPDDDSGGGGDSGDESDDDDRSNADDDGSEGDSNDESEGEGDSEAEGDSDDESEGDDDDSEGEGDSESEGEGDSEPEGEGDSESEGEGDSESEGDDDSEGDPDGKSEGESDSGSKGEGEGEDEPSALDELFEDLADSDSDPTPTPEDGRNDTTELSDLREAAERSIQAQRAAEDDRRRRAADMQRRSFWG